MEDELSRPVVIDNGSWWCRAGFAGDSEPAAVFPSIVARPSIQQSGDSNVDFYFGEEAHQTEKPLTKRYPVEHGYITNWDEMEKLWSHTFHERLNVDPQRQPVVLTEKVMNPKISREKTTQVMFETFCVPYFYLGEQALLSLYSSGRTTGMVVDCGYNVCYFVPIDEGFVLRDRVTRLNVGGGHVTDFLLELLNEKGYSLTASEDYKMVEKIKEELCYVAMNYQEEIQQTNLICSYQLPNGNLLKMDMERIKAPELFFRKSFRPGDQYTSLDEYVHLLIHRCPPEIREQLYQNIVLSGRSMNFPGFAKRLEKEVKLLAPESAVTVSVPSAAHSSWHGGSVVAARPDFLDMCISKEDYDEYGPSLVHKKFCISGRRY